MDIRKLYLQLQNYDERSYQEKVAIKNCSNISEYSDNCDDYY